MAMVESDDLPWRVEGDALILVVRATPGARLSAIAGIARDADGRPLLAVRLAAKPVEGAANTALIALLSKALNVAKRDIALISGETSRTKRLRISGDTGRMAAALATAIPS